MVLAQLEETGIPGAIVGVWRGDAEPYLQAFGVADTETDAPMEPDFHMRIGSLTKSFTVTAILQLADEGELSLDDPIGEYVEGVPDGDVITLRDLARMRSGLPDYSSEVIPNIYKDPERVWRPRELLDVAFAEPVRAEPDTEFDYNNTNTVLLGMVVEEVSGQPLHEFIRVRITEPLGLDDTLLPVATDASIPDPHPRGYTGLDPDVPMADATNWNPSWAWAAGAMISDLEDVGAWVRELSVPELVSPEAQADREDALASPSEGVDTEYGLAFEIHPSGWQGHNGNIAGFITYPYYLPAEDLTLVVMVNSNAEVLGSWDLMSAVVDVVAPDYPWSEVPSE